MKDRTKSKLVRDVAIMVLLGSGLIALPQLKAARGDSVLGHADGGTGSRSINGDVGVPIHPETDAGRASDKQFIRTAFPRIAEWQSESVVAYLDPTTLSNNDATQLGRIMNALEASLGDFHEIDEIVHTGSSATDATGALEQYEFTAGFEKGEAEVELVVSDARTDEKNKAIYSINIDSI